jgi:hypothetical protein
MGCLLTFLLLACSSHVPVWSRSIARYFDHIALDFLPVWVPLAGLVDLLEVLVLVAVVPAVGCPAVAEPAGFILTLAQILKASKTSDSIV